MVMIIERTFNPCFHRSFKKVKTPQLRKLMKERDYVREVREK